MILFSGGNGASLESAMIILGAKTEAEGIKAEHFMINRCFEIIKKSYTTLNHTHYCEGKKHYDRIEMQDEDGKQSEIWFNISYIPESHYP